MGYVGFLYSAVPESCQLSGLEDLTACDLIQSRMDLAGLHISEKMVAVNTQKASGLRGVIERTLFNLRWSRSYHSRNS